MNGLAETLGPVAQVLADARESWWIIGSAAVVLHGAETNVADVDVLCAGEKDAWRLLTALGGKVLSDTGSELFRSAVFGRCGGLPLPIEVMEGFAVRGEPVWLATREWRRCGGVDVAVPSRAELVVLFERFGREKDLARAALLRR